MSEYFRRGTLKTLRAIQGGSVLTGRFSCHLYSARKLAQIGAMNIISQTAGVAKRNAHHRRVAVTDGCADARNLLRAAMKRLQADTAIGQSAGFAACK